MRHILSILSLAVVLCLALPFAAVASPVAAPTGLSFDPSTLVMTVLVYALTTAAKALGLPDATVPVRAFAALVALLIPVALAWHAGTLASFDWNNTAPGLWTAGQALVNAVVVYLAAGGLHSNVKSVTGK